MRAYPLLILALLGPATGSAQQAAVSGTYGTERACKLHALGGTHAVYTDGSTVGGDASANPGESIDEPLLLIHEGELIGHEFACEIGSGQLLCDEVGDGDPIEIISFTQEVVNGDAIRVRMGNAEPVILSPC